MAFRFRRGLIAAGGTALIVVLGGCGASTPFVAAERYFPTGISPRESVVVLLDESSENPDAAEAQGRERSVARCLAEGMRIESPLLPVLPAKEFRAALFPGKTFAEAPHDTAAFLAFLADEGSRRRVEALGVRYLVLAEMRTSRVGERVEFDADHGLWVIGKSWTRRSVLYASVIDARRPVEAGRLSSSSEGPAGFILPVFVIVPLPPVPWSSWTETRSCAALGSAVARFLEGRERPSGN